MHTIQQDATEGGSPDAANGRTEVTGLGHEYPYQGTYARSFDVTTTMAPAPRVPGGLLVAVRVGG